MSSKEIEDESGASGATARTIRKNRVWKTDEKFPKIRRFRGARAILSDLTDDGVAPLQFLTEVAAGNIKGASVSHRIEAAKEILNRLFGKSPETIVNVDIDANSVPDEAVGSTLEALIRSLQTPGSAVVNALPEEATEQHELEPVAVETPATFDPVAAFAAVERNDPDEET